VIARTRLMAKLVTHSTRERALDRQHPSYHLGRCHFDLHSLRVALPGLTKHPST